MIRTDRLLTKDEILLLIDQIDNLRNWGIDYSTIIEIQNEILFSENW